MPHGRGARVIGHELYSAVVAAPSRSGSLIAVVLAFVVLIVSAPIVLGGKTWDDIRYQTDVAPPRLAAAAAVSHGELPAWWDGSGLGVPLLAEPSHGAAYPGVWIAASPRLLDLVWILHLWWCALGVALWARRTRASDLGALVAAVLVLSTGVLASAAIRGALPALAHLPWVGYAATSLGRAATSRRRAWWTMWIAFALGAIALAGELAVLVIAIVIAALAGIARANASAPSAQPAAIRYASAWASARWLAIAIAAGLAIGAVQWLPAMMLDGVGASVHAMRLSRLIELLVPGHFGDGTGTSFPSLYLGVPLLALAALGAPKRRFASFAAALVVLAFIVGRGGWPAVLGAPELCLAAFAILAAVHVGSGVDVVLAGERRALVAIGGAAMILAIAIGAVGTLRERVGAGADRVFLDGVPAIVCLALVVFASWRGGAVQRASANGAPRPTPPPERDGKDLSQPRGLRGVDLRSLSIVALLVAPGIGARESIAPTRERLADAPLWVRRAAPSGNAPVRVYRPPKLFDITLTFDTALATLAGTSAARWGLATAQSTDPARPRSHDRVWLAAASGQGGNLLERYGIELAILPSSGTSKFNVLATNGAWSLVRWPAAPTAAVVHEWTWAPDDAAVIARLFPRGAERGLSAGIVVFRGRGPDNQDEPSDPAPCTIDRWRPGAIDLSCTAPRDGYAVISSTAAAGWSATVDGRDTLWQIADVLRRAVPVAPGTHHIAWRYRASGLALGLGLAALGIVGVIALWLIARRNDDDPDAAN